MPKLKKGEDCCGCTACAAICPKDALTMKPDGMGFKYPAVDLEKCIECGLCEKVCAFNDNYRTPSNFAVPIPFGVRLNDQQDLMKSRSGGAFISFSDWVLRKGGVVYGAGYQGHFVVTHKRATNGPERDEFRGSKYVQSDLDGIFRMVRKDLDDGRWVLFSGTACQVAGLESYIPDRLKERLLTVDIVCHGVPAPAIWKDYLSYIEENERKTVIGVDFRDKKRFGWKAHMETFTLKDQSTGKVSTLSTTSYKHLFYRHIMLRPSCGVCRYCNLRRPADLTLADFWGWEKTDTTINADDKGLSLVLVNTPKGKSVLDQTKDSFECISPRLEDCMQPNLKHPTALNPLSGRFRKDYEAHGFRYVLRKYGDIGWRHKIRTLTDRFIRKIKRAIR